MVPEIVPAKLPAAQHHQDTLSVLLQEIVGGGPKLPLWQNVPLAISFRQKSHILLLLPLFFNTPSTFLFFMPGENMVVAVAWPYANGAIHMGHMAGCYLPPDIFTRFQRMRGNRVLMVSGSDEHGTPITVTAEQEGVEPEVIAKRYHKINTDSLLDMGIFYPHPDSLFTETSTENHKEVVQDLFLRLKEKDYIYLKEMTSPYCTQCQRFLPDRYVEGTCPHCEAEGARGDQCDACGKTLDLSLIHI